MYSRRPPRGPRCSMVTERSLLLARSRRTRRRLQQHAARPQVRHAPAILPTAMPAIAPADKFGRPLLPEKSPCLSWSVLLEPLPRTPPPPLAPGALGTGWLFVTVTNVGGGWPVGGAWTVTIDGAGCLVVVEGPMQTPQRGSGLYAPGKQAAPSATDQVNNPKSDAFV